MVALELTMLYVLAKNIVRARHALKACFVFVWNQGYLPTKGEEKALPKFVKATLFNNTIKTHGDLTAILSSAPTNKFPASVFLEFKFSNKLPPPIIARCNMNLAGNKVIRYATFAKGFPSRSTIIQDMELFAKVVSEDQVIKLNFQRNHSIFIRKFLVSLIADIPSQKRMHPLVRNRTVLNNFTRSLTRAILFSISDRGLIAMCKAVKKEGRAAWTT